MCNKCYHKWNHLFNLHQVDRLLISIDSLASSSSSSCRCVAWFCLFLLESFTTSNAFLFFFSSSSSSSLLSSHLFLLILPCRLKVKVASLVSCFHFSLSLHSNCSLLFSLVFRIRRNKSSERERRNCSTGISWTDFVRDTQFDVRMSRERCCCCFLMKLMARFWNKIDWLMNHLLWQCAERLSKLIALVSLMRSRRDKCPLSVVACPWPQKQESATLRRRTLSSQQTQSGTTASCWIDYVNTTDWCKVMSK